MNGLKAHNVAVEKPHSRHAPYAEAKPGKRDQFLIKINQSQFICKKPCFLHGSFNINAILFWPVALLCSVSMMRQLQSFVSRLVTPP